MQLSYLSQIHSIQFNQIELQKRQKTDFPLNVALSHYYAPVIIIVINFF